MIKLLATALIISLTSCKTTREPVVLAKDINIKIVNATLEERNEILNIFREISQIKPDSLKIPRDTYNKRSDFRELFGFALNGRDLTTWLTKRIKSITIQSEWTIGTNDQKGHITYGKEFFKLHRLEQVYALIHEARHSDKDCPLHSKCPKRSYPYISAGAPDIRLYKTEACDSETKGAYHFHASFLFECYAYGLFDQNKAGLLYNSSISRVLPLITL